jgi:type I site-specific restriction endonuclease
MSEDKEMSFTLNDVDAIERRLKNKNRNCSVISSTTLSYTENDSQLKKMSSAKKWAKIANEKVIKDLKTTIEMSKLKELEVKGATSYLGEDETAKTQFIIEEEEEEQDPEKVEKEIKKFEKWSKVRSLVKTGTFNDNNNKNNSEQIAENEPLAPPPPTTTTLMIKKTKKSNSKMGHNFVVDPSGRFYYCWLSIVSLIYIYNLIFLIARGAFWLLQDIQYGLIIWPLFDYLADFVYIIDILLRFCTGFMENGIVKMVYYH